jgi:vancomycin resistance protein VanJ
MTPLFKSINISAKLAVIILILGIFTSYYNIGFFTVFFSVSLPILFIINLLFGVYGIFIKKYFYLTGAFLFIIYFNFFFQFSAKDSLKQIETVSILSYNVREFNADNDINEKGITSKIVKFIDSVNPDILVLQESGYKKSLNIKNYTYNFLGYRKGVKKTLLAIYSKYPIINTGYVDFPNTINNGLYADLEIHQDTIRLYNIHLQSFGIELNSAKEGNNKFTSFFKKVNNSISKQIKQAELVKKHANDCTKKVIICGDFNAAQYSLPYRILKKGLNDSFINKGDGLGTTYSLFGYPLRLDFFLLDKQMDIIAHENFDLNLSDHEPILIKFKTMDY